MILLGRVGAKKVPFILYRGRAGHIWQGLLVLPPFNYKLFKLTFFCHGGRLRGGGGRKSFIFNKKEKINIFADSLLHGCKRSFAAHNHPIIIVQRYLKLPLPPSPHSHHYFPLLYPPFSPLCQSPL